MPSMVTVPAAGSMRWRSWRCSIPPLGVAARHLALELELHDRHRLLHPLHEERVAQPLALDAEALGGIVAVDGARELLHRRHGDAEALLQLAQPPVAQGDPHDGGDERLLPQARAHPARVVVPPDDGHARLPHEEVDHPVHARAAVAEVPGDDQLGDREVPDHVGRAAEQVHVPAPGEERLDERGEELGAGLDPAGGDDLAEELRERRREDLLGVAQRVAAHEAGG